MQAKCDAGRASQCWALSPGATPTNGAITQLRSAAGGGGCLGIPACNRAAGAHVHVSTNNNSCKRLPNATCGDRWCNCLDAWRLHTNGTLVSRWGMQAPPLQPRTRVPSIDDWWGRADILDYM